MEFTNEQQRIIYSDMDMKINAVAGAGKTSTLIEYARTREKNSRILYLAFNKSVKVEAIKKFAAKGLDHVEIETAHALAYKHIVFRYRYKVRNQAYKTYEIVELLQLAGIGQGQQALIIANHVNKLLNFFCNSNKLRVQDLDYISTIIDPDAKQFVSENYPFIVQQTRILLSKMDKGEIEIIHDFYLKKFQLISPSLPYDYILFDEGQDASAAMLDIFLKQDAVKIIVGDTNQQIYSWRYAVNSLENTNFNATHLSTSFRFNQDIAELAMHILKFKRHIKPYAPIPIKGKGTSTSIQTKAIIARTNIGLLLKAISYISQRKTIKSIYFEGNLSTYTYADEGASLYDVMNLFFCKKHLIRDELIKGMRNVKELREYIEQTGDKQLQMMLDIVEEYGEKIPSILNMLKEKHIKDDNKESADIIFSTVHRCKGMEYDTVQLVNDFMSEEKLRKLVEASVMDKNMQMKLNEEINLLYVAVTRGRNKVYVPESLFPNISFHSEHIYKLKTSSAAAKA